MVLSSSALGGCCPDAVNWWNILCPYASQCGSRVANITVMFQFTRECIAILKLGPCAKSISVWTWLAGKVFDPWNLSWGVYECLAASPWSLLVEYVSWIPATTLQLSPARWWYKIDALMCQWRHCQKDSLWLGKISWEWRLMIIAEEMCN